MVNLKEYKEYWEGVARRVPEIHRVMPVTVDEQMGRTIQALRPGDAPVLFFFPPGAESAARSVDSYTEKNLCVIFVMDVYDPQRRTSYQVLEDLQPLMDKVKALMVADCAAGCPVLNIDIASLNTLPETEFYRNFAGYSLGFTINS